MLDQYRVAWFHKLMEMGMITYEWDGRLAMFQGLKLELHRGL